MRRPVRPEEMNRLHCLIGEAVWYLQHLEDALSTSITLKIDLKDAQPGSVSDRRAFGALEKRRAMTLGMAMRLSREKNIYASHLQERLNNILEDRNWLIHKLLHDNGDDMNVDGTREQLFVRIKAVKRHSLELQRLLFEDLEDFVSSKGVDRDQINAHAQRQLLKARGLR